MPGSKPPLQWGRDRIGIGLLEALRSRVDIEFSEHDSPRNHVVSKSDHIVVCEEGNALAQVVAANYAYSLRAGLHLIPKIPKEDADQLVERFYSLDARRQPIDDALSELRARFRSFASDIEVSPNGSITFIVDALPLGFGFPEVPSTHLFSYPDLGIAIVNGFSSEQRGAPGTNVAVLVDPTPDAPDIEVAKELLRNKRVFIRGYRGPGANVRDVAAMVELYPYDIVVIATHCGDVHGYRSTYRWTDSEGHHRTLVVDEALGIERPVEEDGKYKITKMSVFQSLDGVDWNDPGKSEKVYVGRAIIEFAERGGMRLDFMPDEQILIERVFGSAAMKMYDHNYSALPISLAGDRSPVILNNACASWRELAGRFTFANARAYIGTLFPILPFQAEAFTDQFLGKYFGRTLPQAVWLAQKNALEGRHPYVVTGVFPQRLRVDQTDVPAEIAKAMASGLASRRRSLESRGTAGTKSGRTLEAEIEFYERELASHRKRWELS